MEWAKTSNQDAVMLLVDFEKDYDRVEWDFIIKMLRAFYFPPNFCSYVKFLLIDALALIEINDIFPQPIKLSHSIMQGCPLAPTLFFIAFDAFFYLLRDNSLSPKVHGIILPDNYELLNIQFAYDTSLFLELSQHNIHYLNQKLEIFGKVSRACISTSKSIMLSQKDIPLDWLDQFSYTWGGPNKVVRYLGIPFSVTPSLKDMWGWVKDKITIKLSNWNHKNLSCQEGSSLSKNLIFLQYLLLFFLDLQ